jgi:hypothetical protein
MTEYAMMYIQVAIPDSYSPEQAVEEVRRSIGFGQPRARLLGSWHIEQVHNDQEATVSWIVTSHTPSELVAEVISEIVGRTQADSTVPEDPAR